MYRVMIVDDEQPARERLKRLLSEHLDIAVVREAADGLTALEEIELHRPAVVFLDVDMPRLNGLEVARSLGLGGPLIVFVTAYDAHALAAFESAAIDYVVKPVHKQRLATTLEKLRRLIASGTPGQDAARGLVALAAERRPKRLALRVGGRFEIIAPEKISHITAVDHYSEVVAEDKQYLADDTLDTLLTKLDPSTFIRVHRGAIININHLVKLRRLGDRKYVVVLDDYAATEIAVSRARLTDLKDILGLD